MSGPGVPVRREVLRLMADGLSSGEVGGRLGLGRAEIEHRFAVAILELGARSKVGAIVQARRLDPIHLG